MYICVLFPSSVLTSKLFSDVISANAINALYHRKDYIQCIQYKWKLRIQDSKVHLLLLDSCQNQFQVADSQPPEFHAILPTIKKITNENEIFKTTKNQNNFQHLFILFTSLLPSCSVSSLSICSWWLFWLIDAKGTGLYLDNIDQSKYETIIT